MADEIPEGFIRLTTTNNDRAVIVRITSIEFVRDGAAYDDTYVQTVGGGLYVKEALENIATAIRTPSHD